MRPMPELKVETARVADLLPYAHNAKLHPHEQVDEIAQSIMEFGFNDPIAVWHNADGEMEIVEGHGRLLALKKLRWEECPIICLDHLSDAQRRAYTHVHNQLAIIEGFDLDILAQEIAKIDIDLDDYGFDFGLDNEIRDLGEQMAEPEPQGELFDVLFICHTAEDREWLAGFLNVSGELKPRYEFEEVF